MRELGERTLKDIDRPEPLYVLVYGATEPTAKPEQKIKVTDPTDIRSWMAIAAQAIRQGDAFDPGPMIEQRVLRQIEDNMRRTDERRGGKGARKAPAPPPVPAVPPPVPLVPSGPSGPSGPEVVVDSSRPRPKQTSVADEIDRLCALREQGALNDEQYQRAVDRALAED